MKKVHFRAFVLKPFFLIFLSNSFCADAQLLNGKWVGNSEKSIFIANASEIVVELEMRNDSLITGISHFYYRHGQYEHHKLSGLYNKTDSTVVFIEDSVISYKFSPLDKMCEGIYSMKLSILNDTLTMRGKWKDKKNGLFKCPTLFTWLVKEMNDTRGPSYSSKNEKSFRNANMENKRVSDIQHIIEVTKEECDSIKLELYDNGLVDNDSVSVFFNDIELVSHQRLTERPIQLFISLDKKFNYQKIKMVAENLGSIPPNTALMIITTKNNKYQIHLSSDLDNTGIVEFFLK